MVTKKIVKNGLKYVLSQEAMNCETCREELTSFLNDLGAKIEKGEKFTVKLNFDGKHLLYGAMKAKDHEGPADPNKGVKAAQAAREAKKASEDEDKPAPKGAKVPKPKLTKKEAAAKVIEPKEEPEDEESEEDSEEEEE